MKHVLFVLVAFTFVAGHAFAQRLRIGETMPATEVPALVNGSVGPFRFATLSADLVILEFWSPTCGGCLKLFPKLDTLQQKWGSRLQIVAVGRESADSVRRYFTRYKKIRQPAVPFVVNDKVLSAMFPHSFVPWIVWLNRNREVRYITTSEDLTDTNIRNFLEGKPLDVENVDYVEDFRRSVPLIAEGGGRWLPNIPYYSYLSHCLVNVDVPNTDLLVNEKDSSCRLSLNCASITSLLVKAFGENNRYNFTPANTVQLQVKDPEHYVMDPATTTSRWRQENLYSYDLKMPLSKKEKMYRLMQNDLVNYFDLEVSVVKKAIPCLLLVRIPGADRLKTRGGTPASTLFTATNDPVRYLKNKPLTELFDNLKIRGEYHGVPTPLVNATGYKGNLDIELSKEAIDNFNLPELRRELQRYNLDLVVRNWPSDVLVIKEAHE